MITQAMIYAMMQIPKERMVQSSQRTLMTVGSMSR